MAKPKYVVGIDLGTTNIVASYAPLAFKEDEKPDINLAPIAQELAKGAIEWLEVLPSFIFGELHDKKSIITPI